ncbi:MAG: molybdopterin converting factor subunit 1 [Acidobacteriota bacterium]
MPRLEKPAPDQGPPPVEVTCLLFAVLREKAGADRVRLSLPGGARARDVSREVARRHAALEDVIHRSRIAVNGEFCDRDRPLSSGDEVAIIPPVSGG